ncbi:hypothetical protein FHS19_006448 [Paenibacillus rhizosphaerae]|uniref:Peptidase n=1 Tax=Paenibacillus rhizosphaerae TaxID=297318 RepID=A0A839TXW7_9BACL|nr:DUF1796 family putative cysteine peptidase [Paenibacillus rhizosphaerae]MBB3131725.1 hypothetical protein [Paenibacillus rhizosphaerae]
MKLADIQGTYEAIFSLGDLCLVSIQLEKYNLRPYAGPLDWMSSYNLSDVNRLLANRFARFMDRNNLVVEKQLSDALYLVMETEYNLGSNHDFFTHANTPDNLAAYPSVKAKYDRRVERFLNKCATSRKTLFIRTEGTFEQAEELRNILSGLVAHEFSILLINHTDTVEGIVETECPVDRVCSLLMPKAGYWKGNDPLWTDLLSNIHLDES